MRPFWASYLGPKPPPPPPDKEGGKPPLAPLGLSGPRDGRQSATCRSHTADTLRRATLARSPVDKGKRRFSATTTNWTSFDLGGRERGPQRPYLPSTGRSQPTEGERGRGRRLGGSGAPEQFAQHFTLLAEQQDAQEPRGPAKVIQLPLWPEATRGAPNAVLRGALFAAVHKDRRYLDRELLAAQDGITIRFTGKQLDQADLDVWEQALHLARTQALGSKCYFSAHGFLKALGRQTGKSGHKWLASALARLCATWVEISDGRRTYFGSLIDRGVRDEDTGRYVVEINPDLAKFYGRTQWTQIDWAQRQHLRGKPLALWLHGFYASHAAPHPLTVAYLHKLSGSQTKQLQHFKQNLTQALRDLQAVGAIKEFEIVDDLVRVQTVPSKSQQKHLASRRPPGGRRRK